MKTHTLKPQCLMFATALTGLIMLLLGFSNAPHPVLAHTSVGSHPAFSSASAITSVVVSSTGAPISSTVTLTPTVPSVSQAPNTMDPQLYVALLTHFEKVSTEAIETAKWVVIIIGGLAGVVGAASGFWTIKETREVQNLRQEISQLEEKRASLVTELESKISSLREELEESHQLNTNATNRLRYFLEARDKNSEVRTRAAQKLGASDDIAAVSQLAELLENDQSENVKMEAAYGLAQLLMVGEEADTFEQGVQALLEGTKDSSDKVRIEAIQALDRLECWDINLPRAVHRRMLEIVKHDTVQDVIDAAKETVEHMKPQRENELSVPRSENK